MNGFRRISGGVVLVVYLLQPILTGALEGQLPSSSEQHQIILELRYGFPPALEDPRKNEELILLIEEKYPGEIAGYPATIKAYYGSLLGLRAKHAFFPNRKLKYLMESLRLLDEAVKQDDAELETYFLRFSSLHHMPSLLSIPTKRREDIARILELIEDESFKSMEPDFRRDVIDFMLQSRRLTEAQTAELELLKKQLNGN